MASEWEWNLLPSPLPSESWKCMAGFRWSHVLSFWLYRAWTG